MIDNDKMIQIDDRELVSRLIANDGVAWGDVKNLVNKIIKRNHRGMYERLQRCSSDLDSVIGKVYENFQKNE